MKITAIILSAGKGKRFGKSSVNKTAINISGKSLTQTGLDKIQNLVDDTLVVVGYKRMSVINSITTKGVKFVTQSKRLGTGHAVKVALKDIEKLSNKPDHVLVANGDHLFMISKKIIKKLIEKHKKENNDVTILSSLYQKPHFLDNGRIVRSRGHIISILEKKNFTYKTRSIKELNTGTYVFKYASIKETLSKMKVKKGKELYITEVLFNLPKIGSSTVSFVDVGTGINTKHELENFLAQSSKNTNISKDQNYNLTA